MNIEISAGPSWCRVITILSTHDFDSAYKARTAIRQAIGPFGSNAECKTFDLAIQCWDGSRLELDGFSVTFYLGEAGPVHFERISRKMLMFCDDDPIQQRAVERCDPRVLN